MTHTPKTLKQLFEFQENGKKIFELRKDDRPYKVGDMLLSNAYESEKNGYTGRVAIYRVLYIIRDAECFGLQKGYCIMQLERV